MSFLGLVDRSVDPEDLGQTGDPEDLENPLLRADQLERTVVGTHPLEPPDQDTEARGVEEVDLLHVDKKVEVALVDQIDEELTQSRRRVDIDLTLDLHDGESVLGAVIQLQIHRSSSASPAKLPFWAWQSGTWLQTVRP